MSLGASTILSRPVLLPTRPRFLPLSLDLSASALFLKDLQSWARTEVEHGVLEAGIMDHHDATHLDIGDSLFDSDDGPPFVEKG
jgi:hypothetical protein